MSKASNWLLAAVLAVALAVIGPWLDGQPSDIDAERAGAADLRDAQSAARQQMHLARAEAAMRQDARQRQAAAQTAVLIAAAAARAKARF